MIGLLDGLKTKFTADLAANLTGGFFAGETASSAAMPYLVYHVITAPNEPAYNATRAETVQIQFDVVCENYRAGGVLAESVAAAYCSGVTSSTGVTYHANQITAAFPDLQPTDDSADATPVWTWHVMIEFANSF